MGLSAACTASGCWSRLVSKGCRIDLRVRFEFASSTRDLLLGPAFELTCNGLVDAFVAAPKKLYG